MPDRINEGEIMKLTEYIKKLEEILQTHGDCKVIYAIDDEGNHFDNVHFDPSPCRFDEDDKEGVEFWHQDQQVKVNAVCIN
jgi:hypothetical protein